MTGSNLPPEFQVVDHPGARVWARPSAVAWVRYVLESGLTLHEAAGEARDVREMEGRAVVYSIPAARPGRDKPDKPARWAVRHYQRGGGLAPRLLGDRYLRLGSPRPFREARASEEVRRRGISTPTVMAAAVYPERTFYRADLVTEVLPDTSDLVSALFDTSRKGAAGAAERLDALKAAGELIRHMASVGVTHGDLHAGNVLLQWSGSFPEPHLVDLDRCRVKAGSGGVSPASMHKRLRRSLLKWERRTGLRLSDNEWTSLERGVWP